MVQTNLGIIQENIVDVVPQTRKIKKKIAVNRMFIRIPIGSDRKGPSELEKWCRDHYAAPVYLGNWFKVSGYIVLDEQTYVHWKLCE